MVKHGMAWKLRALEAVGYLLLAPWLAAHAALLAGARFPFGSGAAPAATTLVLFVLPALALTIGMAGLHSLLWSSKVRSLFGVLVIVASLCLIGSVINSAVTHARGRTAIASMTR